MPLGSRASPGSDLAKGEEGSGLARGKRRLSLGAVSLSRIAMRRVLCMVYKKPSKTGMVRRFTENRLIGIKNRDLRNFGNNKIKKSVWYSEKTGWRADETGRFTDFHSSNFGI
jgi:hypothetical protein